ncbi:Na+/H+ antiporter NhaA [Fluviicola taffensis]|uniref:Na(+)/H(+) antiporter NhaA n=1 Tax=Fluviicola taffensis (strain DSM 16823 / NCIMB 13979 / RW262) TaxID=755732 RepID=F2IEI9_FLUTR|nr:Na+/H+ antiporter NhaA [Fluviicola taffensis]AEA44528.1 sodium/proton antiporter, NhaA family [Fluviicola taffensis DSM 16823]
MARSASKNQVFKKFFESEKSSGLTLIAFTILSLLLANSSIKDQYTEFWEMSLGGMTIEHWVNDGLMAIFFLLVGLELKREFLVGELSSLKKATLPIFSALGGMLIPAGIYIFVNLGKPTSIGFGIPMATDIAFALGALSLLGNKVPLSIKVFLTALAVIDDLGAIVVIGVFYTKTIFWLNFGIALGIFVGLLVFNKLKVTSLWVYIPLGIVMWYFMHHSGIHATITGVLLALAIPAFGKSANAISPSHRLQEALHYPVPFFILPLFALVNTAIEIGPTWDTALLHNASLGIIIGLVLGKPIGIFLFTWISIRFNFAEKPLGTTWSQLFGVGILGGIGFTMSIFVTILAFSEKEIINDSKFAILISSLLAGLIGYIWLKASFKDRSRRIKTQKKATAKHAN